MSIAPTQWSPRLIFRAKRNELDVSAMDLGFELSGAWMTGPHNLLNARFAAAAALAMGIDQEAVAKGIETFPGVPHRLERIAEIGGVAYVNDSKATNVAAAVAALESFEGNVHAIMGGSLKGADFTPLAEPVAERCAAVYLTGPAAEPIAAAIGPAGVPTRPLRRTCARQSPRRRRPRLRGATVLLAPACASFDAYRDYEARGDHFRELVHVIEASR